MALARFLQISDLHLGLPLSWLPPERRELRRRDQQTALEQAVRLAIERGAHAILIPGDFFDGVPVDTGALAFATRAFSVAGCPPVFIAPGNHDPASNDNAAWNARLQQARGAHWPANVHVFDTPAWTHVALPTLPGVRVWGRAFVSSSGTMDRPLARGPLESAYKKERDTMDVAVFHGSREGRCPPAQKITGPFSDAEVAESPFAYHAVGHYHLHSEIEQDPREGAISTGVRLAYAGSPVALNYNELGEHGALEVSIRFDHDRRVVGVNMVKLDRRRVLTVQADVTQGASPEGVVAALAPAVAKLAATLPRAYHIAVGGTVEESAQSQASVFAVVPLMLFIILTVLMMQLHSFSRLFLVLSVVPMGLIGIVATLLIFQKPLGFVAILGILALLGMIARNAVILIDQIENERAEGKPIWDAVVEAAMSRFRPIMLTAISTVLGMIPIAATIFWGPMSYAIMGGLLVATLLTLLFLPALYVVWFRVEQPGTHRQPKVDGIKAAV